MDLDKIRTLLAEAIVQIPQEERSEKIHYLLNSLKEDLSNPEKIKFVPTREQRQKHITKMAGVIFSTTMKGDTVSFIVTEDGKFLTPIGLFNSPTSACVKQWGDNRAVNGWVATDSNGKKLDDYIRESIIRN